MDRVATEIGRWGCRNGSEAAWMDNDEMVRTCSDRLESTLTRCSKKKGAGKGEVEPGRRFASRAVASTGALSPANGPDGPMI
ncbi:hypothetical protein RRF57_002181 [Xylaria bambusicola]|uniref:Uncharacterized protein n=1 Tax=Xylaria bambusicola TaxID=326684 RepID=A0AAN7Z6Q4_9PEZI